MHRLSYLILIGMLVAVLLSPVVLASCSVEGGHGVLMHVVNLSCSAEAVQHMTMWQSIFLGIVVGVIMVLLVAAVRQAFTDSSPQLFRRSWSAAMREQTGHSFNMKYFEPLRFAFAIGTIGAKRSEDLTV